MVCHSIADYGQWNPWAGVMVIGLRLVANPCPPDGLDRHFLFIEGTVSRSRFAFIACSHHMWTVATGSFIVVYGPSYGLSSHGLQYARLVWTRSQTGSLIA